MDTKLKTIIDMNGINEDDLFRSVYMDIRESILKEICIYMKADKKKKAEIKAIYHRNHDNDFATKTVLQNVCNLELPDDDITWLTSCIIAFFQKESSRTAIPDSVKTELLRKQNNKCAICGKTINAKTIQVDHIVPWDYVGDKLKDNYQALCKSCNSHKSNHVAESVKNLIITKKRKG